MLGDQEEQDDRGRDLEVRGWRDRVKTKAVAEKQEFVGSLV